MKFKFEFQRKWIVTEAARAAAEAAAAAGAAPPTEPAAKPGEKPVELPVEKPAEKPAEQKEEEEPEEDEALMEFTEIERGIRDYLGFYTLLIIFTPFNFLVLWETLLPVYSFWSVFRYSFPLTASIFHFSWDFMYTDIKYI